MRSRAWWALVIGMTGLFASLAGAVQFWLYGMVSIRPGHDPVSGSAAREWLLFLLVTSAAFSGYGAFLLRRCRR